MLSGWKYLTAKDQALLADAIVKDQAGDGPWFLEIHPSNRCNVGCFFCIHSRYEPGEDKTSILPWEKLEPFLEAAASKNLKSLRLSGGGEPFLYPSIRPLLDLMGRRGLRLVELNTNGTLLKTFAKNLVEVGTDTVAIALNEPTPEGYARSMNVSEKLFAHVVAGVEALREAREVLPEAERPKIRFQFILHKGNWRDLPKMYELGTRLGVDNIFIRSVVALPEKDRIAAEDLPSIRAMLAELIEEDSRNGWRLLFDVSNEGDLHLFTHAEQVKHRPASAEPLPEYVEHDPRREYCFMPWYSALISATGSVHPCCWLMQIPLGNILEQPWEAIWEGEGFRHLRQEVHQLMLLRGKMEYSPKLNCCLQPRCLPKYECMWTYYLASSEFYETVAGRMEKETPLTERLLAQGRDRAIRTVHSLRARLRPSGK